ncbi:MAG: methyltransferase [Undibacterium sp.]|nr:methyltransferase [Undibacterium sp.]
MKKLFLAGLLSVSLFGAAVSQAQDLNLKAAIAGKHRSAENAARDSARHPYETLSFFGIKSNMTVVELVPEGGWYTEILAPYLREHGKLIGAGDSLKVEKPSRYALMFKQKLDSNPAVYDKVEIGVFESPKHFDFAPAGSVDMVLTFRNVHNWLDGGEQGMASTFKAIHTSLKSGGILGVVDHRRPVGMAQDDNPKTQNGYLHQAYVIRVAEAAGFKLAGTAEINANPKDKADHKNGVWSLPPTFAGGEKDKAKYAAIGESDRMTLKFVKP